MSSGAPEGLGLRARASTRSSRGDLLRRPIEQRREDAALRATPHQARRARRRVRATHDERARTPSIGSSWCPRSRDRGSQAGNVAFDSHSRSAAAHPLACPEPIPSRQRLGARHRPSVSHGFPRASAFPRAACGDRAAGKMRLSDFCNRLTTRAPYRPPDSRWQPQGTLARPLDLPRLTCADRSARASGGILRTRLECAHQVDRADESPGGASLDGEPPASAFPPPPSPTPWLGGWGQSLHRDPNLERRPAEHRAVLVMPRSKAPPRHASRRRCLPPRRACGPASDALCREHPARPTFRSSRAGTRQTFAPPWPRQRPRRRNGQDAFRRRVPSPPHQLVPDAWFLPCGFVARRPTPAGDSRLRCPVRPPRRPFPALACFGRNRGILEDPPPSARLCHRAPASSAAFASRVTCVPGRLDRPPSAKGELPVRRFPSTSAIRTAREHNHGSLDLRPTASIRRAQLALGWEQAPDGVGAPPAVPTAASR